MGRRPTHRLAATAVLVAVASTSGCARPVSVDPPAPDAATAAMCAAFTDSLPGELSTVGTRREVAPASDLTAAYGDPPVAVRCGVPEPAALTPTSMLVTIDGVDWLPEELTGGWLLTTVGRRATVEITVPSDYAPAPSVAADLGPAVIAGIPVS